TPPTNPSSSNFRQCFRRKPAPVLPILYLQRCIFRPPQLYLPAYWLFRNSNFFIWMSALGAGKSALGTRNFFYMATRGFAIPLQWLAGSPENRRAGTRPGGCHGAEK